jgi:ubiquinone/menaquinone biosynthesis C-methylase UbiE
MDHREVGRYWDRNAKVWTELSRQGWDLSRDALNTPAFLELLPDISGKRGLDVGCGEGHNTRLLAERAAEMFAVDISATFVRFADESEKGTARRRIHYVVGSAQELPFAAEQFDFVTSIMCLMDVPDQARVLTEIHRVLRPKGFLQFSILHPCFAPPHRRVLRNQHGTTYAIEVGRYFERGTGKIDRWTFSAAPPEVKAGLRPFEIPAFHRTLSEWMNVLVDSGFTIERLSEPHADEATARRVPLVEDTLIAPIFLQVRCRKS